MSTQQRISPARSARPVIAIAILAAVLTAGAVAIAIISKPGAGGPDLMQLPGHAPGSTGANAGLEDRNDRGDSSAPAGTGTAGGAVPEGASVFDTDLPALEYLDPALLEAVHRAATDAEAAEGISFTVTSGWRSPELQEDLREQAVNDYGSAEEAARWVATPETSSHVAGDAIDIGNWDASYWLSVNGAAYGLCQTYANESWHFELRPDASVVGCPEMYLDPTHDPRTQS